TGFLLFDRYVLTNGHVIVNSPPPCSDTPLYMMEFSSSNRKIIMKAQLIGWVYNSWMDFALLELSSNTNLPPSLIQLYGPPSNSGQIKIIGHPGGGG
ncbi:protein FAM111A-like, partial [Arapaima gigas]